MAGNLLISDPSRSNNGLLALVSRLSGGYKFASVLRCVGLVLYKMRYFIFNEASQLVTPFYPPEKKKINK